MSGQKIEYTWKDSIRNYWKIELEPIGYHWDEEAAADDWVWSYKIYQENQQKHSGTSIGQYDKPPKATQIMLEFHEEIMIGLLAAHESKTNSPVVGRL